MKTKIILAALLMSSGCAFAAPGLYLGANVGSTEHKVSSDGQSDTEDSNGAKVYAGYQINPAFGIEVGYVNFGKLKATEQGVSASFKPASVYAALTGTAAVAPSINVFAKVGAAHSESTFAVAFEGESASVKKNGSSLLIGFGAQYKFSENMSVVAEYENFGKVANFEDEGFNFRVSTVSVGLRYAF